MDEKSLLELFEDEFGYYDWHIVKLLPESKTLFKSDILRRLADIAEKRIADKINS